MFAKHSSPGEKLIYTASPSACTETPSYSSMNLGPCSKMAPRSHYFRQGSYSFRTRMGIPHVPKFYRTRRFDVLEGSVACGRRTARWDMAPKCNARLTQTQYACGLVRPWAFFFNYCGICKLTPLSREMVPSADAYHTQLVRFWRPAGAPETRRKRQYTG